MATTQVGLIAAAAMTFVAPLLFLIGYVGFVIYGAIVAVCLFLGTNARLRNIGAEDFLEIPTQRLT